MNPALKFLVSMRLTVVLLALSMVLIFFGTIDQVHTGIWATQERYFESFFVAWQYPRQWAFGDVLGWLHVPMPGGYLLGGLLLANLVAAHLYRFKLSFKKAGIQLVHAGLILLLVSELVTDITAEESQMPVDEGGRTNYSVDYRDNELVLIDRSPADHDHVHSVPAALLKRRDRIGVPNAGVEIEVLAYYPNSTVARAGEGASSLADSGVGGGMGVVAQPQPVDYSTNALNTASAYVRVRDGGEPLGTWLVSNVIDERFPPQTVTTADGREYEIALRFRRTYHPFEVELIDFSHDKYPGTEIPFNFSSQVRVHHRDPEKNTAALIYMNHPLRYEGLTFYQASFANNDQTSIFQVVRNPGWLLPYISVLMMGGGLLLQFGMHLVKFLGKRRKTA